MSSSEQSVLLHASASSTQCPQPHRDRPFRFRMRRDHIEAALRQAGFSLAGLAQASGMPLPLVQTAILHGCTKATARRLVRGVMILTGRPYRDDELVEDLVAEGVA